MPRQQDEAMRAWRRSFEAMLKFINGHEPLTEQEWEDLSWVTLVDRDHEGGFFAPGNVRRATTKADRASNLAFYRSWGDEPEPMTPNHRRLAMKRGAKSSPSNRSDDE